ncbi:MAG: N-acetyltransferase [Coprobacillus sp.]
MNIRQANEQDYQEIYKVVKESFETALHTDGNEQDLVINLKDSDVYIPELSLIAEVDNKIVGHIMLTETKVGDTTQLLLAPLAILPEYQNQGIGSKLILEAHKIAQQLEYDFIILVGHDTYYPRFGYRPASVYGILSPFEIADEVFMAYPLHDANKKLNATIEYVKEFGI